jgi:ATP synthase protein I
MPENDTQDRQEHEDWGALWNDAATLTTLGWDLAVPIFGGVLLGYFLDRRLETGYVFTLSLLFLGIFVGFYNVIRFILRLEAKERRMARQDEEAREE